MENVPGFKSMYGGRVYAEALQAFSELGYRTVDDVVVAARYGVPQRRRRFVMVGWLPDSATPFEWPEWTHLGFEPRQLFGRDLPPTPTAGEALADLAFLAPGFEATRYAEYASSSFAEERQMGNNLLFNHLATRHREKAVRMFGKIPVGGSIRDVDAAERSLKRTMVRLDPNEIANTVVSLPDDMLHFAHHRILSVRECARLQTFDDDFVFIGKRTSGFTERRVDVPQYTQVGNAVPPLLSRALGRALLQSLGAESADLRDVEARRKRHRYVTGSSGYAGYTLGGEADDDILLRTVQGDIIDLPLDDEADCVAEQLAMREWTTARNPRRGQWAPGVSAKANPSWIGEGTPAHLERQSRLLCSGGQPLGKI